MKEHLVEKKPTWWLIYTNGAALVGLVWLLEVSVAGDAARLMLETGGVAAMIVLMLRWLRVNRGRIELAETRVTRRDAVELPAHDGSRAAPPRVPPRMWLDRPARGARRVS